MLLQVLTLLPPKTIYLFSGEGLMFFAFLLLSYLIGSLPPAIWISRYYYGTDIRKIGSGNAGSTNMYRNFGWKAGALTQALDISKGSLAATLPTLSGAEPLVVFGTENLAPLLCGIAAIIGHVYPIFAGFRGGKGVNTVLGVMLALQPLASLIGIFIFITFLLLFRMVSLASMAAVASFPFFLVMRYLWSNEAFPTLYFTLGIFLSCWIIFTHRANISRILKGTESKIPSFLSKFYSHSGK
jgi:glycerol-3-phosphate acyltransferase PlsY